MMRRGRDILFAALATIVVGVAAIGIAIGMAGLRPADLASPSADAANVPVANRYVCISGHASFTLGDLETAPPAEVRQDVALDLLRALLAEQAGVEESDLPSSGWRRVVDGPDEVVFMAEIPGGETPYAVVNVMPGGGYITQGGFAVDSFGPCLPTILVPDDVSVATWWVDPDAQPTGPASERIPALVLENACASGRTAEGRILPPAITYSNDAITITILVSSLGAAECPGHPFTPYIIELDEPIGDRALLDGGQWPPGDPLGPPQN